MHFVAMALRLVPQKRRSRLTVADGVYAHAAALQAIGSQASHLGRMLHNGRRHKRMSVAIVRSDERSAMLRLAFMAQEGLDYAHALMDALATKPILRLGRTTCEVESVDLTNSGWAGISTWADLIPEESSRHIRFAFATATAIMKRAGNNGRFSALFPEPLDIFSGLARRWRSLEGPPLPDNLEEYLRTGGCVVSDYRLHTEKFRTKKRTQIGFTGWVIYECRRNEHTQVLALNALARLAFFTGVGYQTARGMGAVKTTFPMEAQ